MPKHALKSARAQGANGQCRAYTVVVHKMFDVVRSVLRIVHRLHCKTLLKAR